MLRAPAADRALLKADDQRDAELAAGHVPHLGRMIDQLAHRQRRKVDEHDLDDRPLARDGGAGRHSHDAVFADRRIDDAAVPETVDEVGRNSKWAANRHVLAKHDDACVLLHLALDGLAQTVDVPDFRHIARYAYTKSATD